MVISAPAIFQLFDTVMSGDVEATFRGFVRAAHTRTWMVSADFALSGEERANDTFAFTVFRYDKDDFAEMLVEAGKAIHRDLKKVKSVN